MNVALNVIGRKERIISKGNGLIYSAFREVYYGSNRKDELCENQLTSYNASGDLVKASAQGKCGMGLRKEREDQGPWAVCKFPAQSVPVALSCILLVVHALGIKISINGVVGHFEILNLLGSNPRLNLEVE